MANSILHEQGGRLWRRYLLHELDPFNEKQLDDARIKAEAIVHKLAPELHIDVYRVYRSDVDEPLIADAGGMYIAGGFHCCSFTFLLGGLWVPELERALTFYLYWKLFPDRFRDRAGAGGLF